MGLSTVVIASRFRGPPGSGNGGYVAGLVGARAGGPARVRLHVPPPLDRAFAIETDGEIRMMDGATIVASCSPMSLDVSPPAPPSLEEAGVASRGYRGFARHPFPSCFVCGPDREEGDGLRIFPGPLSRPAEAGGDAPDVVVVAAPFAPPRDLIDAPAGTLAPPVVWAALDCTGYFAIVGDEPVPMLLGELAVDVRARIGAGPHVVYGWSLGGEGRKARCGTALASPDGRILAVGLATWIRPKDAATAG